VSQLDYVGMGWSAVRLPRTTPASIATNQSIAEAIGLFVAPPTDYGRLSLRTVHLTVADVIERIVTPWSADDYGPSWRLRDVTDALERHHDQMQEVPVILMEDDGQARRRKWDVETGFVNLFQGRDVVRGGGGPSYPGDRVIGGIADDPGTLVVQIHRVVRRDDPATELLALAVHLGNRKIVRKGTFA